ncbi:hypothetical protein GOP47_0025933 [Adiantum capillus-veneris]|uniref:Uncharacterized protein n=1 Tax=Adiantum capillus-veneris TaxID=13818 RepID=A0A9D4U166_ADICA|nr:hypothetical protein GOP47_0025933 [Adiantum capillus-veneris]
MMIRDLQRRCFLTVSAHDDFIGVHDVYLQFAKGVEEYDRRNVRVERSCNLLRLDGDEISNEYGQKARAEEPGDAVEFLPPVLCVLAQGNKKDKAAGGGGLSCIPERCWVGQKPTELDEACLRMLLQRLHSTPPRYTYHSDVIDVHADSRPPDATHYTAYPAL